MLTAHTELPVAAYRQSVLAAFQEVEDNLAALRILGREARTQDEAVRSAEGSPALSTHRYKGGPGSFATMLAQGFHATPLPQALVVGFAYRLVSVFLMQFIWPSSPLASRFLP